MSSSAEQIFWQLHNGLPREGPGSDACTRRAFELLVDLPEAPHVLDLGCGPGAQTLELARLGAEVTAIDTHGPFIEELVLRATKAGANENIDARVGDMNALEYDRNFDVVWCEGAIYFVGFEKGLASFARYLKPSGYVAVTEVSWLTDEPSPDCLTFWEAGYPAIQSVPANLAALERSGFEPIGSFALPESAWWDDYYAPLEIRLNGLVERYAEDPAALEVLAGERAEIELFREHPGEYGYVFYIGRAPVPSMPRTL